MAAAVAKLKHGLVSFSMVRELEACNDSQVKREQDLLRRVQDHLAQGEQARPAMLLLLEAQRLDTELLEDMSWLGLHLAQAVHGMQSSLRVQEHHADNAVRIAKLPSDQEGVPLDESALCCRASKGAKANLECHRRQQAGMADRMLVLRDNRELLDEQIERCRARNTYRDMSPARTPTAGGRRRDGDQDDYRRAPSSASSQFVSGQGQRGNDRGGRESDRGRPPIPGRRGQNERPGERNGRQN